ncbi:MAG TPA: heme exporter protein CcmD [Hyphomicrobiales bacterium]|nr:heme exporter protein CcmD [Hyphomicrobiales bacterium]
MVVGQLAFVYAAYGFAAAILLSLVVWVVADHRIQRRTLADLEARGIRRRSASPEDG